MQGMTGLVFVTQGPHVAEKQIEEFYNFADMQMAIWCDLILKISPHVLIGYVEAKEVWVMML